MGVLQMYIWYVEKNVFYQGVDEDVTKKQPTTYWKWSSVLKKYVQLLKQHSNCHMLNNDIKSNGCFVDMTTNTRWKLNFSRVTSMEMQKSSNRSPAGSMKMVKW
jgi:hypothetical protein